MSRKLLLADGSAAIQRVVELMFSSQGVDVVAVDDGQQAIERLPAERPDVVLASIGTARRSGYEVAAFVRDHPQLSHVPVLLLAGAFEPVDEARAREVGSAGVLVKPLAPHEVVSTVRSLAESTRQAPAAKRGQALPETPPDSPKPADEPGSTGSGSGSLDDYFERLDAAFATLRTRRPPEGRPAPPLADAAAPTPVADVPTVDGVLGVGGVGGSAAPGTPSPRGVDPAPARAPAVSAVPAMPPVAAVPPELTDEQVERITRRVVERLGRDAVRDVVEDVVSEVAERLVRQEIDRIRNR